MLSLIVKKGNWSYEYRLSCQLPWELIFPERLLTLLFTKYFTRLEQEKYRDAAVQFNLTIQIYLWLFIFLRHRHERNWHESRTLKFRKQRINMLKLLQGKINKFSRNSCSVTPFRHTSLPMDTWSREILFEFRDLLLLFWTYKRVAYSRSS